MVEHHASLESIDDCGFSPLQSAAYIPPLTNLRIKTVECLLRHGADPTYINTQRKQTAALIAIEDEEPEVAEILLKAENEWRMKKQNQLNSLSSHEVKSHNQEPASTGSSALTSNMKGLVSQMSFLRVETASTTPPSAASDTSYVDEHDLSTNPTKLDK